MFGWRRGTSVCPTLETGAKLEGWGVFWLSFIGLTVATIVIATAPQPWGLGGMLERTKVGRGLTAAIPMDSPYCSCKANTCSNAPSRR